MVLEKQHHTTADLRVLYVLCDAPLFGFVKAQITRYLHQFVDETGAGLIFGFCGYELSEKDEVRPDISFVSRACHSGFPLPEKFMFAPDLAIEVLPDVLPFDQTRDTLKKVETYGKYGTRLVWVVYPDERAVDVYTPAEGNSLNIQSVKADSVLGGGEVLPGFSLPLSKVFPPEVE